MKKSLMNKFTLKILSLVIAILIWLMVTNVQDPNWTVTFRDIPVTFSNESYIESTNRVPLMVDGKDSVDVEIRGKRSVVGKLKEEDLEAVADLTQIVDMNSDPIMVPVTVTCPGAGESASIKVTPQTIPITIEDRMSKMFTIAANTGESRPNKDFEVGSLTVSPETVNIVGPTTVVEKIDKVVAQVDVTDMTESTTKQSTIKIYDKNQEEMSEKQMSYLRFDLSSTTVSVGVELWRIKQDVPIEAAYSGEPKAGYKVSALVSTPDKVSIAGTDEALKEFEDNGGKLEIPPEMIDVSGQSSDFDVKVDLEDFLPENINLATDVNTSALITVKILPYNSQEFEIPVNVIEVENKPEDCSVVYELEKVSVRVRGDQEDLDNLDVSQIGLCIDVKSRGAGTYELPLEVSVPQGYQVIDEVKVKLRLVKVAENTAAAQNE